MWYELIALRIYLFMITNKNVQNKGEKPQPCKNITKQQQHKSSQIFKYFTIEKRHRN